jgi:DNA adenine methylase
MPPSQLSCLALARTDGHDCAIVPTAAPSKPRKQRKRRFPVPHPFLKWAGGKRALVPQIEQYMAEHLPGGYGTYHEPFVGGGALFFHLKPPQAFLSDNNERLVRAYKGVRNQVEALISALEKKKNEKEFFLRERARGIDRARSDATVAAWLIYLNKAGFNGLYRVNKRNLFNVPYGKNPGATICDHENLRACSRVLQHTSVAHEGFEAVSDRAQPGDFVYFDPPYVPLSDTSYFTSYTREKFGPDDQERLRDVALDLKKRGVHVLLSNSSAELVKELYADGFQTRKVQVRRNINANAAKRGPVTELLIW